jgi:phosphate-selective porin OprO/OprP
MQAEWAKSMVESRSRFFDDPQFWAASLQASYFLTGEHRPYKQSNGTFGNVKPKENYTNEGGTGAWELAARYSHLNLNDHNVFGGRLNDVTLGVNWYLNPSLRMAWNYVWADASSRHRDAGEVNIFQWRVQLAF